MPKETSKISSLVKHKLGIEEAYLEFKNNVFPGAKKASITGIIKKAKKYLPDLDSERVIKAYHFAKQAHKNQFRASGEPYIQHPLEVTDILLSLKPDEDSIVAALLHDVLEDTEITADDMRKEFDEPIIPLLKGLEKLENVYYRGEERQIENLRKMFLAMAKDIRVILIKLADRLHNMRTLEHMREDKRKRIAEETLSIYSPIASRLGIYHIKSELDDLCFKHLYPDSYKTLSKEINESDWEKEKVLKQSKANLQKVMKKAGIKAEIDGRVKQLYSIYKKLKRKNKNYASEIYDVFALRVIVESEAECYQTLGVIHKHWNPLSRRFKDYIANKKPNGYQSLHTTVVGLCNEVYDQPIEIQIRSRQMDEVANFGVAAHWHYKERGKSTVASEEKMSWVKNLVDLHENLKNNNEFIESLNVDIFSDRIFVLTPKGDVMDLPEGATPIDFAYKVHRDVGHKCRSAKVNGRIVPLNHELKNGQVVDILTKNIKEPNRYWLSFVKTSQAKSAIKQWFNAQERDNLIKLGKEMINKHLKRLHQPQLSNDMSLIANYEGKKLTTRQKEELLEKIGNGSVDVMSVIKKVVPQEKIMRKHHSPKENKEALEQIINVDHSKILITGQEGYKTQIATCCAPTTKDEIAGYITRGRGITIHKKSCKVLSAHEEERITRASWQSEKNPEYEVTLRIKRQSRIGMLRDVSGIFANSGLNILDFENLREKKQFIVTFSLDSLDTLNEIIRELESIPDVFEVMEI